MEGARGPIEAVQTGALRCHVHRIIRHTRLLPDRPTAYKPPKNLARDDVQGIDAEILGCNVGNLAMAADGCRDGSIRLEMVEDAWFILGYHKEKTIGAGLEKKVRGEDRRLFDARFRPCFRHIIPEIGRLRSSSLPHHSGLNRSGETSHRAHEL